MKARKATTGGLLAVAALSGGLLLVGGTAASAAIISKTNSTPVVVDGSSATRTVEITAADLAPGSTIDYLTISIDFAKCDDPPTGSPLTDNGSCSGDQFSFNNEIVFRLTSPDGTTVNLVNAGTFAGQIPGARVQVLFDDAATTVVGGPSLQTGSFRPVGSLSDFIGKNALGTYTLFIQDTFTFDPLGFYSFTLNVTSAGTIGVPEPTSLALFGAGLLGLGLLRRCPAGSIAG